SSDLSTDVQAFIGELDGGVFETKIGAVLSEVASGVMNTKTKGKVSLNLEIEPFDENRVKIKHKLSYVRPTNRGKISEEDTTETPMYVNRGGRLTILQEDQGQLLTLAGEPDGKLRAAGR
ncbi:protein YfdP, partial [Salmonella enterica]|uniref:protein YfdP n=1 Tax=Salmonella enterica TaxID=28901 RepID=UPI0009A9DF10